MKVAYIIPFLLLCSFEIIAQEVYESPYVFEGTTFQINAPKGLHPVKSQRGYLEMAFFVADTSMGLTSMNPQENPVDMFMIMSMETPRKQTLDSLLSEMTSDMELSQTESEIKIVAAPELNTYNGQEFLTVSWKGDIKGVKIEHYFYGITQFGNQFVMITYFTPNKKAGIKRMKEFVKILESFQVIPTEKENKSYSFEDTFDDVIIDHGLDSTFVSEPNSVGWTSVFNNERFKISLRSSDETRIFDLNQWNTKRDVALPLMTTFDYNDGEGLIHVLYDENTTKSMSESELVEAITESFKLTTDPTISFEREIQVEPHVIKEYSLESQNGLFVLYTIEALNKTFFFIGEILSNEISDFPRQARDFVESVKISLIVRLGEDEIIDFPEEVIPDEN